MRGRRVLNPPTVQDERPRGLLLSALEIKLDAARRPGAKMRPKMFSDLHLISGYLPSAFRPGHVSGVGFRCLPELSSKVTVLIQSLQTCYCSDILSVKNCLWAYFSSCRTWLYSSVLTLYGEEDYSHWGPTVQSWAAGVVHICIFFCYLNNFSFSSMRLMGIDRVFLLY